MPEPRIVTPQEAQERIARSGNQTPTNAAGSLLYTVATEPERTRAAVVKALRHLSDTLGDQLDDFAAEFADKFANSVENGADL